ncbi:hypothetical protein Tco_0442627 [Tanacetum coccineum]
MSPKVFPSVVMCLFMTISASDNSKDQSEDFSILTWTYFRLMKIPSLVNDVEYVEAHLPIRPVSSKVTPANRSYFMKISPDELAQIISNQSMICFFKEEPELGNFHNDVYRFQTFQWNPFSLICNGILSSHSFHSRIPPSLTLMWDEDTNFDLAISKVSFLLSRMFSKRVEPIMKFNTYRSHLNIAPDCEDSQFCHIIKSFTTSASFGIRYPKS